MSHTAYLKIKRTMDFSNFVANSKAIDKKSIILNDRSVKVRSRVLLALWFISMGESARNALNAAIWITSVNFEDNHVFFRNDERGTKDASSFLCRVCSQQLDLANIYRKLFLRTALVVINERSLLPKWKKYTQKLISNLEYKNRNAEVINEKTRIAHKISRVENAKVKTRKCLRCGKTIVSQYPGLCKSCRNYAARTSSSFE